MSQDFAVILLDVCMPIMDGFETAALIRQRHQSEMTPIIFITASESDEIDHADLYAEGAVDFIFAPVPPDELRAKVSVFANLFLKATELASHAHDGPDVGRSVAAPHRRRARSASSRPTARTVTCTRTRVGARSPASRPRPRRDATGIRSSTPRNAPPSPSTSQPSTGRRPRSLTVSSCAARARRRAPLLLTSKSIPDRDGGIAGWVGTLADVTAEAGVEAAMSEARDRGDRGVAAQVRLPCQHESRDPDPDERRDRHGRSPPRDRPRRPPARLRADGTQLGRGSAHHHQRHPRLLEGRSGASSRSKTSSSTL